MYLKMKSETFLKGFCIFYTPQLFPSSQAFFQFVVEFVVAFLLGKKKNKTTNHKLEKMLDLNANIKAQKKILKANLT